MAWNEPGGGDQHDPWSSGGRRKGGGNRGGGNGGNNQGPPDLDEALKKFQQKINSLLGKHRKGGGRNGGGDNGGGKSRSAFTLPGLLIIVALAIWAASGFYLVDQAERGVVLRFGKFQEVVTPGLQWNPPLVDDVRMVNVTRVRSLTQTQSMLTRDENIVKVEISAQYRVSDPGNFMLNVRDPNLSIENALDSSLRHVVGGTDMIDILTSGREILGSSVASRLQTYLDNYDVGIQLQTINIESTSAPEPVIDAFDDVIRAREDRQRTINKGIAYANAIIPEAQGQAQRLVEQGQGYRESVVAEAQGQANRFTSLLSEYRNSPETMRERLYIEAIEEVFGSTPKVLLDTGDNAPLMYLPLDKLRGKSGASSSDEALDPDVLKNMPSSNNSDFDYRSGSSRSGSNSGNTSSNTTSNTSNRTSIRREGR